jgi:hypothetical protein
VVDNNKLVIYWYEDKIKYGSLLSIVTSLQSINNGDWVISKTDLRKRKLELIRND